MDLVATLKAEFETAQATYLDAGHTYDYLCVWGSGALDPAGGFGKRAIWHMKGGD